MRFLMKFHLDREAANEAARKGTLASTIQSILEDLKPEATYFGEDEGERTAFLVVNLANASELPRVAEPWFLAFNARVRTHVVMTPEDLAKAGPGIAEAVKKFG
jgi:hypothetical protein